MGGYRSAHGSSPEAGEVQGPELRADQASYGESPKNQPAHQLID